MPHTPTSNEKHATVRVANASDVPAALAQVDAPGVETRCVVLPSSLRRDDPAAAVVRARIRSSGGTSTLLLPATGLAALAPARLRRGSPLWMRCVLRRPDGPRRTVRLPARLDERVAIWSVTDVDVVRGHGPYVLDLLERYLHPLDRLRQAAAPARDDAAADVNLGVRMTGHLLVKRIEGGVLAFSTTDPIAAELFALALADEDLAPTLETAGPWEERVVQRATELQLGVAIPDHLHVTTASPLSGAASRAISRVCARIDVRAP
jgi:hypothetical protein